MAYDRVVDSAKLETAITATADAIRAKTGGTEKIPWDADTGYQSAVEGIPEGGGTDVSGVTATEADVLEGAVFVDSNGEEKEGSIPRNGEISETMDGIEVKSVSIPAGYTTGGTVALDGTIDGHVDDQAALIAEIAAALDTKVAGGAIPAEGVKFTNTAIDPDVMYAIGYNWFAEVVSHVQQMVGKPADMTPADIAYWLGRVKYIPQGNGVSECVVSVDAAASGSLPAVQKSSGSSICVVSMASSATGTLTVSEV